MIKQIGFFCIVFFFLQSFANAAPLDHSLIVAAEKGEMKEVRSLLRRGANPNAANDDANTLTALMLAVREGHTGVVRVLIEAAADVNTTAGQVIGVWGFREGITALGIAISSGDTATMELLLKHKAPNAVKVNEKHENRSNSTIHVEKSMPIVLSRMAPTPMPRIVMATSYSCARLNIWMRRP